MNAPLDDRPYNYDFVYGTTLRYTLRSSHMQPTHREQVGTPIFVAACTDAAEAQTHQRQHTVYVMNPTVDTGRKYQHDVREEMSRREAEFL